MDFGFAVGSCLKIGGTIRFRRERLQVYLDIFSSFYCKYPESKVRFICYALKAYESPKMSHQEVLDFFHDMIMEHSN